MGMTDKQIAEYINLAPQTVRNRLSKMMTDAGLNNRTHLATYWLREQSLSMQRPTEAPLGETI
jgi:DNA-binding NarL/FixJ family response regulator